MSKLLVLALSVAICVAARRAWAEAKNCEDLKNEIAAKLDAKGVKNYTLEIVPADNVKDEKVVGTCDAGTKRIVYKRQ